jgi:hypothetical protein
VLACVFVLTIVLGASPSSVETAHNQLQKVIAIKENWKDWTRRFGHEQLTWLRDNGMTPAKILPSQIFITSEELGRRNLPPQPSEWSVSPKYVLYFYVNLQWPPANVGRDEILAWAQNTEQGLEVIAGGSDSGGFHSSKVFKISVISGTPQATFTYLVSQSFPLSFTWCPMGKFRTDCPGRLHHGRPNTRHWNCDARVSL